MDNTQAAQTPKLNILLVEDDRQEYERACELLSRVGGLDYSLQWASSFDDGLSALQNADYDVCLVDVQLNGRGGMEFLQAASRQGCDAPIIMLSTAESRDEGLAALRAGAADFLVKGRIQPPFLARSIQYALERKRSEREARDLEKQLMYGQKMRALGELSARMAADLNEVLGAVIDELNLIQAHSAENKLVIDASEAALERCKQASFLADHLLACSKKEIQAHTIVNLQQIVLESVEFLARSLPKKITVTSSVTRSHQLTIRGCAEEIRQALINLALNAQEAMPEGGTLHFRFTVQASNELEGVVPALRSGNYVRLDVRDSGRGIAEEHLQRVFEPSFTTKNGGNGLGLGLSAVYSIMESHHGWVSANSKLGAGSTFSLYFPLVDETSDSPTQTVAAPRKSKGLVFVLEEEAILAELMKLYLEAAGFSAKIFTDPKEAFLWYSANHNSVDLALLDVYASSKNGTDCFSAMRQIAPNARIAIFAPHLDDRSQTMLGNGALRFFQKPPRYPLVITWVAEILGDA